MHAAQGTGVASAAAAAHRVRSQHRRSRCLPSVLSHLAFRVGLSAASAAPCLHAQRGRSREAELTCSTALKQRAEKADNQ